MAGKWNGHFGLNLICLTGLFLVLLGCREKTWEPEVVALVNEHPIHRVAVDQVLEWGFYPDLGQGGEREITIPQIIDKLIDEQLVLAEAEKIGLTINTQELEQAQALMNSAWFGAAPPPAELAELRQTLQKHLLLKKMTEKVMVEQRILSAQEWRKFWKNWPKSRAARYLVRLMLLPPSDRPPFISGARTDTLESLGERFKKEGLAAIISGPLWLSGDRLAPPVRGALEKALAAKTLAGPLRLQESWATYEVLEIEPGPSPTEDFKSAQDAFETLAGEKAFRAWLGEIKSRADIEINPGLAY